MLGEKNISHVLFLSVLFISLLIGCKENQTLPENNDFSYLDSEASRKQIAIKEEPSENNTETTIDKVAYNCMNGNVELVGTLNQIEYFGAPGYGATPAKDAQLSGLVLKLKKIIEVKCDNNTTLKCMDILLEIPEDMTFDHLMGGTISARGQISISDPKNLQLPVKMVVLRMESLKPVLQ